MKMGKFHRQVEVIYCDDIRQELGHKNSIMGVYGSDLIVNKFPFTIQKLCLSVRVLTPINEPFISLEIFVYQGTEDDKQIELIATGPLEMPSNEQFLLDGSKVFIVQTFFALSPLQINEETVLRVKVKTEREELRGIGLRIKALEN